MEKGPLKVLGIDVGTTSVKMCVIDALTEKVIEKRCSVYRFDANAKPANKSFSQQNVKVIIDTVQSTLKCIERSILTDVEAITVCGQMHGVVLWQHNAWNYINGEYLIDESKVSDLYTWQDKRCDDYFLKTLPESSVRLATGYGCATLFWLNTYDHDYLSRFAKCGTIMDLLVAMICDLKNPVISLQNAVSFGFCDPQSMTWNVNRLKGWNFPINLLPQIVDAEAKEYSLFNQWISLKPKVKVFTAFGDTQCAVYAAIRDVKGRAVLNAGTSMQMCLLATNCERNESISIQDTIDYFPYFKNKFLTVAASLNGGNVLQAFVDNLTESLQLIVDVKIDTEIVWNRLLSAAVNNDALHTCDQLQIDPRIFGERCNPQQKGSISGISLSSNIPQIFAVTCRSLIENIFSLISIDVLRQSQISSLIVTGTLFSGNPILRTALLEFIDGLRNDHNICIDVTFNSDLDANVGVAYMGASLLKKKIRQQNTS